MIDQATLDKWIAQARRDDWHRTFVGSDIRVMLAEIERLTSRLSLAEKSIECFEADRIDFEAEIKRLKAELERANDPTVDAPILPVSVC